MSSLIPVDYPKTSRVESEDAELQLAQAKVKANEKCFVAGTLVHTKEGLRPIEQIKVGDWVLSQPEGKGELSYKPVTRTFVHEEADFIWFVQINYIIKDINKIARAVAVNEVEGKKLYIGIDGFAVTDNHPFFAKNRGWVRAVELQIGDDVELVNGDYGHVSYCAKIFQTNTPNVGWAPIDERGGGRPTWGYRVDFMPEAVKGEHLSYPPDSISERPQLTRTVHNFEVDGNHTYYVGESGLWAHNKFGGILSQNEAR